ncbi:MAG TPA: prohibitin family protein [Bacteroidota bacterium]|nr:prohibitin family protein [Bacteroidota bacterium]
MLFVLSVIVSVVAFFLWRSAQSKLTSERNIAYRTTANVTGLVSLLFAVIATTQTFTVVPAGNVGVVDFFGVVSENTLKSGINFVNPLARVIKFTVQTQELKELMDVPSKEGLTVSLEISAIYHLNPEKAAEVYKMIGPDYIQKILEPQFRSVARGVTAGFDAKALYTSEREMLAQLILKEIEKIVEPRGITVEATPLRRVGLPAGLQVAIESKLRAEQESQQMQFVLQKERQEADRKRIEAQGISDFQNIIARSLSQQVLTWKGVEATEKLANSQNSKVIVIGGGKNGLPLILNTQ